MQEGKQILKTGETPVLNVPNHGLAIINEPACRGGERG